MSTARGILLSRPGDAPPISAVPKGPVPPGPFDASLPGRGPKPLCRADSPKPAVTVIVSPLASATSAGSRTRRLRIRPPGSRSHDRSAQRRLAGQAQAWGAETKEVDLSNTARLREGATVGVGDEATPSSPASPASRSRRWAIICLARSAGSEAVTGTTETTQGATIDRFCGLINERANRPGVWIPLTRGRQTQHGLRGHRRRPPQRVRPPRTPKAKQAIALQRAAREEDRTRDLTGRSREGPGR